MNADDLQRLERRIEELERVDAEARGRIEELERLTSASRRRARRAVAAAALMLTGSVLWTTTPEARAQFGITLASLHQRLMAVEAKTQDITRGPDPNTGVATVRFSGVNVQVVDGSNTTSGTSNGSGNLIVGYNELRGGGNDVRTGSHNLILGTRNNYSSFGGQVVGLENTISGEYALVSGGFNNTASGNFSSVSGGSFNTASGLSSSVSGGFFNTASARNSSVSGGLQRSANSQFNWRAGGLFQDF